MATIVIDNKPYAAKDGQNLLQACLSLGFDLPYFCWHPAMHSVGACRQCAIKEFKDDKDARGRIVMACMTAVRDGMRISIEDPEAKAFRASIIELLMTNHPHDCPVCDEGGECHLQDMTVMTGHTYREFRFRKRTHRNQHLGPFVNHEMIRCIQCYRCVRFYADYAGGRDFAVLGWNRGVYFGRHQDGVLESEFSGNLVEVCPTGVFTDKSLKRHFTRKWDLMTAPSVCVHCGLGCNTIPGERYGTLRRIRNRYHGEVNGYFLCDRGRYGYEFLNSDRRIRQPVLGGSGYVVPPYSRKGGVREEPSGVPLSCSGSARGGEDRPIREKGGTTTPPEGGTTYLSPAAALSHVGSLLSRRERVIGIGSPRASLEANFALRTLVGPERFYQGVSEAEARLTATILRALRKGPARTPSLADAAQADAIFVLGEDVTNTAPRLALALRQALLRAPIRDAKPLGIPVWNDTAIREAVQDARSPLFVATPDATKLDDVASRAVRGAPDDLARLGFAVAHAVSPDAPAVADLPKAHRTLAVEIAQALKGAERPLIVSGTSSGSEAMVQAAANVAWALRGIGRPADLAFTLPECNTLGLALMGSGSVEEALRAVQSGAVDTAIVLENDLYRRADQATVDALFAAAKHVVALDHLANATTAKAEVVLPAATFAESTGTFVSSEGRAQRFFRVFVPAGEIRESWEWLAELDRGSHERAGSEGVKPVILSDSEGPFGGVDRDPATAPRDGGQPPLKGPSLRPQERAPLRMTRCVAFDDLVAAMAQALPVFRGVPSLAPPAGFRVAGAKIPRQPHRYSGRTAMTANVSVHEPPPPADPDSALAFSMEGYDGKPPSALLREYWAPGWNSVQALNKFQSEVGGPLAGGDPGLRLIEPSDRWGHPAFPSPGGGKAECPPMEFFREVPPAFEPRAGEWLVVPVHHIFGSEELSVLSPGIAELAPKPYLGMNSEDAKSLGVAEGAEIELSLLAATCRLPIRLRPAMPRGIAGLPTGLPGVPAAGLPAWGRIAAGK